MTDATGDMAGGDDVDGSGVGVPADEVWALIDALFDGQSTAEDRRRLHHWVTTSPDAARMYARAAYQWALLPRNVCRPAHPAVLLARFATDSPAAPSALSEAMILPALVEPDPSGGADEADADGWPTPLHACDPPAARIRWYPWAAGGLAAAAAVALAVGLWPAPQPTPGRAAHPDRLAVGPPAPPATPTTLAAAVTPLTVRPPPVLPAATVTAAAGAAWDRGTPTPGERLAVGTAFELSRGGIELTFDSGAVAVVAAPARVRVVDRNRMELRAGSITASVPPRAVGFAVVSPGLSVVDLGTQFGIRTGADGGSSEVAVFKGVVDAAGAGGGGPAAGVRVTAGHAVAHPVGGSAAPAAVDYAPGGYLRDVADVRLPVPTHGTGQGLAAGSPDPGWTIAAVPGQPGWMPRPAVVAVVDRARLAANTPEAAWISLAADMTDVAAGEYTFRTTIDLTGFDPGTAAVTAGLVGDGQVVNILVNGVGTADRNPPLGGRTPRSSTRSWTLAGAAWRAGTNDIEVVVLKRQPARGGTAGPVGLRLGWAAVARPTVRR